MAKKPSEMTREELIGELYRYGIKGTGKMAKRELIEKIQHAKLIMTQDYKPEHREELRKIASMALWKAYQKNIIDEKSKVFFIADIVYMDSIIAFIPENYKTYFIEEFESMFENISLSDGTKTMLYRVTDPVVEERRGKWRIDILQKC